MGRRLGAPTNATLTQAAEAWWNHYTQTTSVRPQTLHTYRTTLNQMVLPTLGGFRLQELTTGIITRALDNLAATGLSKARQARVVLKHILTYCVRNDALTVNPIDGVPTYLKPTTPPQALTINDLQGIRTHLREWLEDTGKHAGLLRATSVVDCVDFMIATGCRTGEALAVRWRDLSPGYETVTISGTIIQPDTGNVYRQDTPKTAAGHRTLALPPTMRQTLERRRQVVPKTCELVFPGRGGAILGPNNYRRTLRQILKNTPWEDFTPYMLRKTTATHITRSQGLATASAQLGHTDTKVTARHYAERNHTAPDTTTVTESLLAGDGGGDTGGVSG